MSAAGEEFARPWEECEVAVRRGPLKRFRHPVVGLAGAGQGRRSWGAGSGEAAALGGCRHRRGCGAEGRGGPTGVVFGGAGARRGCRSGVGVALTGAGVWRGPRGGAGRASGCSSAARGAVLRRAARPLHSLR
ncbi:hypothetical protein ABZZ79_17340 [Streptomyces sp. NPDC006458]|uniref:hypothetical protein n=1 Tax=Streptomyces sp. NPDC006458 TaxID=3154302 RepID=UPI0033B37DF3